MSVLDFSNCKTIEEINAKLLNSRDIPNDVARANVFVQHLLQKELILEQNKFQKAQLDKMEALNKLTRNLVVATWALVVITLAANVFIQNSNINSASIKNFVGQK